VSLVPPVHFVVCPDCGQHGHLVFSDGSKGSEVTSTYRAMRELEKGWKGGKVLDVELVPAIESIQNSQLPGPAFLSDAEFIALVIEGLSDGIVTREELLELLENSANQP